MKGIQRNGSSCVEHENKNANQSLVLKFPHDN